MINDIERLSRMHDEAIKMKEYYRDLTETIDQKELRNIICSICSKQAALCEVIFAILDNENIIGSKHWESALLEHSAD